jgi:hypothetical protein
VIADVVGEPAWWEKYELPMLPSAAVGWGGGACSPIGPIVRYLGNGVWRARNRGDEWRPGWPGGRAWRSRDALSGRMNGYSCSGNNNMHIGSRRPHTLGLLSIALADTVDTIDPADAVAVLRVVRQVRFAAAASCAGFLA